MYLPCHVPLWEYQSRVAISTLQNRVHLPHLVPVYSLFSRPPDCAIFTSPKTVVCTTVCLLGLPTIGLTTYVDFLPRFFVIKNCTNGTASTTPATVFILFLHSHGPRKSVRHLRATASSWVLMEHKECSMSWREKGQNEISWHRETMVKLSCKPGGIELEKDWREQARISAYVLCLWQSPRLILWNIWRCRQRNERCSRFSGLHSQEWSSHCGFYLYGEQIRLLSTERSLPESFRNF